MASGMEIGGDGSVAWKVVVEHVRRGTVVSKPVGACGFLQAGIDETKHDESFTIGIKVPRDKRAGSEFARALLEAAKDAEAHSGEPGYRVKFPLPIEPKNEDQIQILWQSSEPKIAGLLGSRAAQVVGKAKAKPKTKARTKTTAKKSVKKKTR